MDGLEVVTRAYLLPVVHVARTTTVFDGNTERERSVRPDVPARARASSSRRRARPRAAAPPAAPAAAAVVARADRGDDAPAPAPARGAVHVLAIMYSMYVRGSRESEEK